MEIIEIGSKFPEDNMKAPTYPIWRQDIVKYTEEVAKILQQKYPEGGFNLYCMGSSGIYVATILDLLLPISDIIYVRKMGENGHNHYHWEKNGYVNVFVDDFIETGNTFRQVYRKVVACTNKGIEVIATVSNSLSLDTNVKGIEKDLSNYLCERPQLFIKY